MNGKNYVLLFLLILCFFTAPLYSQNDFLSAANKRMMELYKLGDYGAAQQLGVETVIKAEERYGKTNTRVAILVRNLALIYKEQGKYDEAEKLYLKSLNIFKSIYGESNVEVATSLNNLGVLYTLLGRYDEAEIQYKKALSIKETIFGQSSGEVTRILHNLGMLFQAKGDETAAQTYFERANSIRENSMDYKDMDSQLEGMSEKTAMYIIQGNYDEAESLMVKTINIRKNVMGDNHPDNAKSYLDLATLYQIRQKYDVSRMYSNLALQLMENIYGKTHPRIVDVLRNIAMLYIAQNDIDDALVTLKRMFSIESEAMSKVFSYASESDKLAFIGTLEYDFDLLQSAVIQETPSKPSTVESGLKSALKRKGVVLDAMSTERLQVSDSKNPEYREKVILLNKISTQIANYSVAGLKNVDGNENRKKIDDLYAQRDILEKQLSETFTMNAMEDINKKIDEENISKVVPSGKVFVEYSEFTFHNFSQDASPSQHYIAYVISPDKIQPIKVFDLGEASVIDQAIFEFRSEMAIVAKQMHTLGEDEAEKLIKKKGKSVYDLILFPLKAYIYPITDVLISPDGNINLIPFSVLTDENSKYLIETFRFHYLNSGKDLFKPILKSSETKNIAIYANPDYNYSPHINTRQPAEKDSIFKIASRSFDLKSLEWTRLQNTETEAMFIKNIMDNYHCALFTNSDATEENIKNINAPSILHIATHGFFLNDKQADNSNVQKSMRGIMKVKQDKPSLALNSDEESEEPDIPQYLNENPMLRSGLVFASANRIDSLKTASGQEDGILTALEISGLNLRDTDLVVLSACDTGLGKVKNGEGVFGLRRAFQLSGAKTLIMSLWEVPDKETLELMKKFYMEQKTGKGKSESLYIATIQTLSERRVSHLSTHPFYWGAFVSFGEQ